MLCNTQNRRRTLDQARQPLRHVSQDDLPPPVLQEAIQRRRLLVVVDGIAHLGHPAGATIEQSYLIPRGVM